MLWIQPSQPDNYVDGTFLSRLRRNSKLQEYSYSTLIFEFSVLLHNLALGLVFVMSFVAIYRLKWDPKCFALPGILPVAVIGGLWASSQHLRTILEAMKSVVLTVFAVMALTPVFRSLTESTSSDSIWSIATWLFFMNVVFASRTLPHNAFVLVLSTNTALATAIVLASRLQTSYAVFCFIIFSMETYVVLPSAARWLRISSEWGYWTLVITAVVASDGLVYTIVGVHFLLLWLMIQTLIFFGGPKLFLVLQKHKDQIAGPWDPAKPSLE